MATIKPTFSTDKINQYLKKYRNITFKAGDYNITKMMICPSNTIVKCEPGVIFHRQCRYQMLEMEADPDIKGYNGTHHVEWHGGYFKADDRGEDANVIVLYHCNDILLEGIIVYGCRGYHSIECNSSSNITIRGCNFENQSYIPKETYREAIQIDFAYDLGYPYRGECGNPASDGTHCKNISIENCDFTLVPNGIGTHTVYEKEKYHENITIKNCRFAGIEFNDIRLLGMKNVLIEGCKVDAKIVLGMHKKGYNLKGEKVKLTNPRRNLNINLGTTVLVE